MSSEWAVSNGHETLLSAAAVVTDMCAVTVRCMAANSRAWADEQELWMLSFSVLAALACTTPGVGAQGT